MDVKELRSFTVDELKGRVRQWRDELFRSKFKSETAENRDTSVFRKLKRDIARALTVMNEMGRQGGESTQSAAAAQDAGATAPTQATTSSQDAGDKPAPAKKTSAKSAKTATKKKPTATKKAAGAKATTKKKTTKSSKAKE